MFTSNPHIGPSNAVATPSGFEQEDLDLQAALQASLNHGGTHESLTHLPPSSNGSTDSDPVTASMARNRMLLARMQEEQAQALKEGYEQEIARIEALDRARRVTGADGMDDDDKMEDIEEFSDVDKENEPEKKPGPVSANTWRQHPLVHPDMDDDAELEAAIKESLRAAGMEDSNEDQATSTSLSATRGSPTPVDAFDEPDLRDVGSEEEEEEEHEQQKPDIEEPVSVDELRRRRLARFGG
jgi:ataxin-3